MIVANAGYEGAVVVEKVKSNSSPNYGFNAETESYGDLVAEGVIDPTKVTRAALQNAASIASLLLTTEASVSECADEEEKASAGSAAGMGGGAVAMEFFRLFSHPAFAVRVTGQKKGPETFP